MTKIIIGLTGLNVSGKSTVADYLQTKHGAVSFAFSTALRDIIKRLHLPMERANIANLSTALRREFGPDLLSRVLLEDIKATDSPLIILVESSFSISPACLSRKPRRSVLNFYCRWSSFLKSSAS